MESTDRKSFRRRLLGGAVIAAVASVVIAAAPQEAEACSGFLACTFVAPLLGNDAADAADDWNARNGKIVDHGVAALLDVVVPGTGEVLEGVWTAQDIRNSFENGDLSEDDAVQLLGQLGEALQ